MKKLYIIYLFFWCLPLHTFSQEAPPDVETQLIQALGQMDYSTLQTGIHIDRIPGYLPISIFDGTCPVDSLKVSWSVIHLLYGMLERSQWNSFPLQPLDSLIAPWISLGHQDTTIIGGIWCTYDRFKSIALDSQLISFDSLYFHAVPGAPSPFEQSQVFAFSPVDQIRYGLQQTLILDPTWMFTNQPGGWQDLEIDADDGLGWRAIDPGEILSITYPLEGVKVWQMRMILPCGDTLLSAAKMEIWDSEEVQTPIIRGFLKTPDETLSIPVGQDPITWKIWVTKTNECGDEYWEKVDASLPEGLTAYIFYNQECETPALRKPLFLVNGFDPGRSHGWEFIMGDEGILKKDYQDIGSKLLSEHLHDEKYDIIYVSFSDATGDIRTNAAWLQQLIETVNDMKAAAGSTEKNVVIGASMGGLVSKWALLTMQNAGKDHETELFMTVDSPLRGANISLGLQAMIKDLAQTKVAFIPLQDLMPSLKFGLEALASKGAQQMLYYNWTTAGCTYCDGDYLDNEHDAFFDELEGLGTLNIPHIGLSNGSINGVGNNIQPSDHLLTYSFFQDLLISAATPCFNQGAPINPTTFYVDIDVWAAPGYSGYVNPLVGNLSGVVFRKKTTAHLLGINWPSWSVYKVDNITSWDHAPGGLRSFNSKDKNGAEKEDFPWARKSFCFIPTVSALDIAGADPFYTGYYLQDVEGNVEAGNTTLRSYVGAVEASLGQFWEEQTNQEHVSFDRRTANFTKSLLKTIGIPTDDNPLINRIFNYGKVPTFSVNPEVATPINTRNVIDYDLSINSNGQLWVNRDDHIGYTDVTTNPINDGSAIYDVHIRKAFCDGSDVVVDVNMDGSIVIGDDVAGFEGQLIVHDHTSLLANDGGNVLLEKGDDNNLILEGGQMTIHTGGVVKVLRSSRILINEGSTLTADTGGKLYLDQEAKAEIGMGGELVVKYGSSVFAEWGSLILVKNGGLLVVEAGGKLFIKHDSSLEVEEGGKLILEPGAEIFLWDGQNPEGEATIHIHGGGELEWQGDILFSGNGFFQFDAGNIFTALADWNLAGMGREFRMIRLNNNATLNVNGVNMYLSDGGVEFEQASSLDHYSGENRLEDVRFYGAYAQSGFGMNDFSPTKVFIDNCHFDNLEFGYNLAGFQGVNPDFILQNSLFEDCVNGLTASPASWISIDQSVFDHCVTGAYFKDVKYAYLNDCSILGDAVTADIGVFLEDTPVFRMHGGVMDGLDDGIQSLGGNQSNVFLYSQATISNCDRGIYIEEGGVNSNSQDFGMILIDCANLINNKEGVIGKDILLQVDAVNNATHHPNQMVTPNTFVNGDDPIGFDDIFQICYDVRDAENVFARQNVWGTGTPNNQYDFDNHDIGTGSNGCDFIYNKVDNIVWSPTAQYVVACPLPPRAPGYVDNGGLTTPPIFGSTETCVVSGGTSIDVHDRWARGLDRFYAEDLNGASTWLDPIAGISNSVRDTLSQPCRHYIDVARVLTDAINTVQGTTPAKINPVSNGFVKNSFQGGVDESDNLRIQLSPNPAQGSINIQIEGADGATYRIVSALGLLMDQGPVRSLWSQNLQSWPEGMYELQVFGQGHRFIQSERFMVVR